jgi:hypothetical protein
LFGGTCYEDGPDGNLSMKNLDNILAYRIKTYLTSLSMKTKFHYNSFIDEWTINVNLPNGSTIWYSWLSFKDFLLGDYSVFGNYPLKKHIPNSDYLISDSLEELAMKMDLLNI